MSGKVLIYGRGGGIGSFVASSLAQNGDGLHFTRERCRIRDREALGDKPLEGDDVAGQPRTSRRVLLPEGRDDALAVLRDVGRDELDDARAQAVRRVEQVALEAARGLIPHAQHPTSRTS